MFIKLDKTSGGNTYNLMITMIDKELVISAITSNNSICIKMSPDKSMFIHKI